MSTTKKILSILILAAAAIVLYAADLKFGDVPYNTDMWSQNDPFGFTTLSKATGDVDRVEGELNRVEGELQQHKEAVNPHGITPAGIGATTPEQAGTIATGIVNEAIGALPPPEPETDPIAIPRIQGLEGKTNNWNSAYSWGNHAMQGYLTHETDAAALQALGGHEGDGAMHLTPEQSGRIAGAVMGDEIPDYLRNLPAVTNWYFSCEGDCNSFFTPTALDMQSGADYISVTPAILSIGSVTSGNVQFYHDRITTDDMTGTVIDYPYPTGESSRIATQADVTAATDALEPRFTSLESYTNKVLLTDQQNTVGYDFSLMMASRWNDNEVEFDNSGLSFSGSRRDYTGYTVIDRGKLYINKTHQSDHESVAVYVTPGEICIDRYPPIDSPETPQAVIFDLDGIRIGAEYYGTNSLYQYPTGEPSRIATKADIDTAIAALPDPTPPAPTWQNEVATNQSSIAVTSTLLAVAGNGNLELTLTGLADGVPVYAVVYGADSLEIAGAYWVGGAAYVPDRRNHYMIWQAGGDLLVNTITTTAE